MKSQNPRGAEKFKELVPKIPQAYLDYQYLDKFFEESKNSLPNYLPDETKEISSLGFVLFWMSMRGCFVHQKFETKDIVQLLGSADIDAALDLVEGIYFQKWHKAYEKVLPILRNRLCAQFGIIVLEELDESISSQFITDVFEDNSRKDDSVHNQTMEVVSALRKLYPGKQKYAAKILGADFMPEIPIPDGKKI